MVDQAANERAAQGAANRADKHIGAAIRLPVRDIARIGITIGSGSRGSRSGKARRNRQRHRDAHEFCQNHPCHAALLKNTVFT
ncbi:MAG: hypothetical protein E6G87_06470 [Alphaproteobacteria bacterium]|nr:MAG: hypothetical protein E6G87_06470 [Alphaproteobacteria bacterium]